MIGRLLSRTVGGDTVVAGINKKVVEFAVKLIGLVSCVGWREFGSMAIASSPSFAMLNETVHGDGQ